MAKVILKIDRKTETATVTRESKLDPIAIDTRLATLWSASSKLGREISEMIAILEKPTPQTAYLIESYRELLPKRRAAFAALETEAKPLIALYEKHRWARFFLVTNQNGHVHSAMNCSTTFPTTRWAWLPELSGKSERDAVAEHGEKMCTICFPSAPAIAREVGPSRSALATAEAKTARAAARDERAAKERAKQLFDDGHSVTLKFGHISERLRSIYDAKTELKSSAEYALISEWRAAKPENALDSARLLEMAGNYRAMAGAVAELLAARLGESAETILAAAMAKAKKVLR